jgi:aspartate/methionine/tyrosine aminotransferase
LAAVTSSYLSWAKASVPVKYNLAISGMPPLKWKEVLGKDFIPELFHNDLYGFVPLKEKIATYYNVSPSNVALAAGTSFANHLAMAALLSRGDEVLIEYPVYEPLVALAGYLGAKVIYFSREEKNNYQPDPDEIASKINQKTKLIIITNLHNPSSALIKEEEMIKLGDLAALNGAYVLSDEVYLDAVHSEKPRPAALLGKHFITTSSITKVYGFGGLRCGWIIADEKLISKIELLNDLFSANNVQVGEIISSEIFNTIEEQCRAAIHHLDANRKIVNDFLDVNPLLECHRAPFGTTYFPRLPENSPPKYFFEILKNEFQTFVVPGKYFGADHHFRLGLTSTVENLKGGLEGISHALEKMKI